MPQRLLLLSRLFLRLDNVLLRIRDTRIYVEFATGEVIREYIEKEDRYEEVRLRLASQGGDVTSVMRDANRVAELLHIREHILESVTLS
jgi:type 2A phosphatase activator TIP41